MGGTHSLTTWARTTRMRAALQLNALSLTSRNVFRRSDSPTRILTVTGTLPLTPRTAAATSEANRRGRSGMAQPPPLAVTLRCSQQSEGSKSST